MVAFTIVGVTSILFGYQVRYWDFAKCQEKKNIFTFWDYLINMHLSFFLFLCHLGVEAKFGVTVGKMNWIQDRSSWSLIGLDGKELGHFDGVVASDKNLVSPRFSEVHGVPPPLGPFILSFFQQYCKFLSLFQNIFASTVKR